MTQIITQDIKGCQGLNYVLSKNKQRPISERKLSIELDLPENLEWNQIHNLAQQTTLDTNSKYFQYRILNIILATNTFLTKIRIKNDKKCTFCKLFDETLIHLFYECDIVQNLWQSVIDWIKTKSPYTFNFNFTAQNIIFGITENTKSNNILNLPAQVV